MKMPRFLQALSKQQHQKSIVILHENTKIERNTKMSDNDTRKGECGKNMQGAKKNKQKHRKKCHDDET